MTNDVNDPSAEPTDEPNETGEPTATTASESEQRSGLESPQLTRILNSATPGVLRISFTSRDVTIAVDGDLALRLVTGFRRGRGDGLDDELNRDETDALGGWVALDFSKVMLVEWQPGPDAREAMLHGLRTRLEDAGDRTKR